MGIDNIAPPDGAFYLYADISNLTNDTTAFCRSLLADTGVAITSGLDFAPDHGNRTIRISYCGQYADTLEAVDRMENWLQSR